MNCGPFVSRLPPLRDREVARVQHGESARELPSASPSIEIVTISPGMQWTVCGALSPSFCRRPGCRSITFLIRGAAGFGDVDDMDPDERKPGTISVSRWSRWHADEHAFQPKWWSSSPTFGISVRCTISPYVAELRSTSTTAMKSGGRSRSPRTERRCTRTARAAAHGPPQARHNPVPRGALTTPRSSLRSESYTRCPSSPRHSTSRATPSILTAH